ncbi:MAG: hypothetical protein ACK5KP_05910 [Paludibacteraceae bacterium]
MNKKTILGIILALICNFSVQSQVSPFSKLSVGLGLSTYGGRIELSTPITSFINLRGGFSLLPYTYTTRIPMDAEEYRDYIDYDPDLKLTAKLNFSHAHVLADFSPFKSNSFYLTTGLFFGSSKITGQGILLNPSNDRPTVDDLRDGGYVGEELPEIEIDDDYAILPDHDGSVNGNILLGSGIKPYVGLGIGRTIPNSKIGFRFDLGAVYQGEADFTSPNMSKGTLNDLIKTDEIYQQVEPFTKWYTMINLQISYRIF